MALINCVECGKEISDKAKFCPNCGMPLTKKGRGFAIASLVLGVIACVYTLPIIASVSIPNIATMQKIASAVYIMIFSGLSLIFGLVSHFKGCKLKKKTAGIILGAISTCVLLICVIVCLI